MWAMIEKLRIKERSMRLWKVCPAKGLVAEHSPLL